MASKIPVFVNKRMEIVEFKADKSQTLPLLYQSDPCDYIVSNEHILNLMIRVSMEWILE